MRIFKKWKGNLPLLFVIAIGFAGLGNGRTVPVEIEILFDPIEDYSALLKNPALFGHPNILSSQTAEEKWLWGLVKINIVGNLHANVGLCPESAGKTTPSRVFIYNKIAGSFTKAKSKQAIYVFGYCQAIAGSTRFASKQGLAIVESGKLLAQYYLHANYHLENRHDLNAMALAGFSVADINQNGLSELLLLIPEKVPGSFNLLQTQATFFEFPNLKYENFASFNIQGPTNSTLFKSDICPKNIQNSPTNSTFFANKLYVQKGGKPTYYLEKFKVTLNCKKRKLQSQRVARKNDVKPTKDAFGLVPIFVAESPKKIVPAVEKARAQRRILFENSAVLLFRGVSGDTTSFGSIFLQDRTSEGVFPLNIASIGQNPLVESAVSNNDGSLVFFLVSARFSDGEDSVLVRYSRKYREFTILYSSRQNQQTEGISSLAISPDGKVIGFLGINPESRVGLVPWGIVAQLGEYSLNIESPFKKPLETKMVPLSWTDERFSLCFDMASQVIPCGVNK